MKRLFLLAAALMMVFLSSAETYYLITSESGSTTKYAFDNADLWSTDGTSSGTKSAVFDSSSDYVLRKSTCRIRIAGEENKEFKGGKLVVGVDGYLAAALLYTGSPYAIKFANEGLELASGCLAAGGASNKFITDGKFTVANATAKRLAMLCYSYKNQTIRHQGAFVSETGKTLYVGSTNKYFTAVVSGKRFELAGDCSGYNGTLVAATLGTDPANGPETTLAFGTTTLPGSVELQPNSMLTLLGAGDVLTVGNLSADEDVILGIPVDGASVGRVVVTGTATLQGPITIRAPATSTASCRVAVFSCPATCGLTADDFILEDGAGDPVRNLSVETEGETTRVYLSYKLPVYQVVASALFGTDESWSDGTTLAVAGKDYILDTDHVPSGGSATIKVPSAQPSVDFAGDSLTIGSGCTLYTGTTEQEYTLKLAALRLLDGAKIGADNKCALTIRGGTVDLVSGVVEAGTFVKRFLTFDSELTGSGTLSLIGKLSGASSSPYGNYRLNALNTNFLGRIKVGLRLTTYVTANDGYQGLYLADGRSLGGTLQEFDPKALVLTQWARLVPEGSVTLSAASRRGVFIDGGGGFNVGTKSKTSVPYVLRLETALALNGELRKDGVGTLDLAGTTAFGADAMGMTPESGKNIFAVSGGVVRVSSAGAIDGFETHFAAGTSLELAIDLGNEDLTRQGIRNAKTDTPFVLPAGETKLPLAVRNVGSAPADGTKEFSVGFVTVSAAAVDSVKAMLSNTPPKVFKGYRGRWLEPQADEQTGAVTLAALYEKTGMCLILR